MVGILKSLIGKSRQYERSDRQFQYRDRKYKKESKENQKKKKHSYGSEERLQCELNIAKESMNLRIYQQKLHTLKCREKNQ